jgi:hypothetical protein
MEYITRPVQAEDLQPGQRVLFMDEVSVIEAVEISPARHVDPYGAVSVRGRREIVPAGISPTWGAADEPWNEYDVIVREF